MWSWVEVACGAGGGGSVGAVVAVVVHQGCVGEVARRWPPALGLRPRLRAYLVLQNETVVLFISEVL